MANCITELKTAIKFLTLNTDRLLEANKMIMNLEQDIFHEKWKVRHLTRLVRHYNPDEPISEEELDAEIKGGMN
jgi:hypothetical protein|tara:strand:+ start:335 stop:556 length:222 start_codon:yes stop_codon:yes gene_type:complete